MLRELMLIERNILFILGSRFLFVWYQSLSLSALHTEENPLNKHDRERICQ